MNRRSLVAVGLCVTALSAIPAAAGDVRVGTVSATQYDYPYFAAMVQASGTVELADVHLVVNADSGTPIVVQPDKIQASVMPGGTYVIYNIYKYATGVVRPGDTLTAVVRDADADSGDRTVQCGFGSTKKKSRETATCK